MGKGAFPEDHPLSLGMIGMHGRPGAMKALEECDLLIVVGSRLADRSAITGEVLSDKVAMIRIDVEPPAEKSEDINDIMLVGDAKSVLGAMIRQLPERQKSAWSERTMQIHDRCACDVVSSDASIDPRWVMHELNRLLPMDTIITTDVGQNQMWAAHFLRSGYPRHFITSGGFGTMGFGFPAAMGVKCAFPKADVVNISGDGGFQMVSHELATAMAEDSPLVVVVMNNGYLGMVRQWQDLFNDGRTSSTRLRNNPDLVRMAEAYGAEGAHVERPSELSEAMTRGLGSDHTFHR